MKSDSDLDQWLDYISSIHHSQIDLGLKRLDAFAQGINLKHFPCPVITVSGTNGKGSCVQFLEQIYLAAGYRVAAYYSPHLLRFNERISILGKMVSDEKLLKFFLRVEQLRGKASLSFFEYTTLAALLIFQSEQLDVIVLEVGLGGRLDAVNIVDSDAAIVSSVGLDHQAWLGNNRESIGREKAGIFRQSCPAISGDEDPPFSIFKASNEIGSIFYQINKDFFYSLSQDSWEWRSCEKTYSMLPRTQLKIQNAACSLMAVETLQNRLPVDKNSLKKGLSQARLPGRFEIVSSAPSVILDVAHNSDAVHYLLKKLSENVTSGKTLAVLGMLEDKDFVATLRPLLSEIDAWYVGTPNSPRTADSSKICSWLRSSTEKSCYSFSSISEALQHAMEECSLAKDRVLVFGSFVTVAEAKNQLGKV